MRQSIKQAYRHARAALKRSARKPGDYVLWDAYSRAEARFRGLALAHLQRLRPWANHPAECIPDRALECVRRYYTDANKTSTRKRTIGREKNRW